MENSRIVSLEKALKRERAARKQAENILEMKSLELYEINQKLKMSSRPKQAIKAVLSHTDINDAYVKIDMDGNFLAMNEAAVKVFGYDIMNEPVNAFDLIYRDDYSHVMAAFRGMVENGNNIDFVARAYSKNNPVKTIHVNAEAIYDDDNKPIAAEGFLWDITQESKMKELLAQQEEQLSIIVNNSSFGIVLSEGENIKRANQAFQDMVGYTHRELVNMDSNQLFRPEDIEDIDQARNSLKAGKKFIEFVHFIQKKDGSLIKTKINVTNVVSEDKRTNYRVSIIKDITEESRKQEIFEEQKKQLEIIVENSPLGISLADTNGFTKVNKAFCNLLGYSETELSKLSFKDITYPTDLTKSLELSQKMFEGQLDDFTVSKRYIKKKGGIINAKTHVSAVRDSKGDVKYIMGILEDITEQVKSEQFREQLLKQLKKSNNELHEYAHVVSHDLKSPLRNISAIVSWIREDCKEIINEKGNNNLVMIENTVEKMENLINGILTYSSISQGEEESIISIDETVRNIVKMLYVPDHVTITIQKTLPKIYGDQIRMQQLFQNLIGNAINYMDKKEGEIIINCEEEDDWWLISIQDNGIGIAKEYHEKIFGIFQSLNSEQNSESTGIGLSIVKKIVELYGGEISLTSEVGKGTTFYVKLKKLIA
ncbi:PAS domain S-box protein [Reichenbachiella sp. MALMAid0571]|uniref:PAS domain S-box protein n=1 Tax=Reichenbachiella sp. MALMAid0571 TaxID=3143939 RepID=UPI0032DE9707